MLPAAPIFTLPPTVLTPKFKALITPVTVAAPVPSVFKSTAPVYVLASVKLMGALFAVVMNVAVPPTLIGPLSLIVLGAVTFKLPPTLLVPKLTAVSIPLKVAFPVPLVFNSIALL